MTGKRWSHDTLHEYPKDIEDVWKKIPPGVSPDVGHAIVSVGVAAVAGPM